MSPQTNRAGWFEGSKAVCEPLPQLVRDRAFRIVLLGPPGVGKGTQAQLLCDRLRMCHLSTGDLFRAATCQESPSPAMSEALQAMRSGRLVSDELVMAMVRERDQCLRCHGGFLLDGVPRTVRQAEILEKLLEDVGVSLDAVVSYDLPIEDIVDRIGGRRTCGDCKAVFHVTSRPPKVAGVCDICRGQLLQRDDDRPEAVRVRMKAYHEATEPLNSYYRDRNKLLIVSARGKPTEILQTTLNMLEQYLAVPV